MRTGNSLNLIIAGIGGQGVLSAAKWIQQLCFEKGMKCQGSVFKGGAQTLGSIHAQLRIFTIADPQYLHYSPEVLAGNLDVLIGFEPSETLRFVHLMGEESLVYVNTRTEPILSERTAKKIPDPLKQLRNLGKQAVLDDFTLRAIKKYDDPRMMNYDMLCYVFTQGSLPFQKDEFTKVFLNGISLNRSVREKLTVEN